MGDLCPVTFMAKRKPKYKILLQEPIRGFNGKPFEILDEDAVDDRGEPVKRDMILKDVILGCLGRFNAASCTQDRIELKEMNMKAGALGEKIYNHEGDVMILSKSRFEIVQKSVWYNTTWGARQIEQADKLLEGAEMPEEGPKDVKPGRETQEAAREE